VKRKTKGKKQGAYNTSGKGSKHTSSIPVKYEELESGDSDDILLTNSLTAIKKERAVFRPLGTKFLKT
jgi:hypothetical protein